MRICLAVQYRDVSNVAVRILPRCWKHRATSAKRSIPTRPGNPLVVAPFGGTSFNELISRKERGLLQRQRRLGTRGYLCRKCDETRRCSMYDALVFLPPMMNFQSSLRDATFGGPDFPPLKRWAINVHPCGMKLCSALLIYVLFSGAKRYVASSCMFFLP